MKLLVAEDEKQLADALHEILTMSKYLVDIVYDGEEAIEYINMTTYDGVILDVMMPKKDGIEVLRAIRASGNSVPVMMLTAKSEVDDKVAGLDAGADDYLAKPFATKELLARVRAMTRRRETVSINKLSFGNISLNSTSYELCSETKSIPLTNKEYQVIEMLLINKTNYITSERFMEHIWGYNSESEINVVWSHISSVRKKLEELEANFIIKSARNLGYILEGKDDR